jgi:hypothetical protein
MVVAGGWFGFAVCSRVDDESNFGAALRRGWRVFVTELPLLFLASLIFLPFGAYITYLNLVNAQVSPVTFIGKLRYVGTLCWQLVTWALFVQIYHRRRQESPPVMPDHDDADDALGDEY